MSKAVASVTMTKNVPTRVDFQSQLETNLGRKQKRKRKGHVPGKGRTRREIGETEGSGEVGED